MGGRLMIDNLPVYAAMPRCAFGYELNANYPWSMYLDAVWLRLLGKHCANITRWCFFSWSGSWGSQQEACDKAPRAAASPALYARSGPSTLLREPLA